MATPRERFLSTYRGKRLLEEHHLAEDGFWQVYGEDPNCDWGGSHYEPFLGTFHGTLTDVINAAVNLSGFWQWGSGGKIVKTKVVAV